MWRGLENSRATAPSPSTRLKSGNYGLVQYQRNASRTVSARNVHPLFRIFLKLVGVDRELLLCPISQTLISGNSKSGWCGTSRHTPFYRHGFQRIRVFRPAVATNTVALALQRENTTEKTMATAEQVFEEAY